jgi:hypothetical protein
MGEVSTIGLDIAKSVFQIHGVDPNRKLATQCATPPMTRGREEFGREVYHAMAGA